MSLSLDISGSGRIRRQGQRSARHEVRSAAQHLAALSRVICKEELKVIAAQ